VRAKLLLQLVTKFDVYRREKILNFILYFQMNDKY